MTAPRVVMGAKLHPGKEPSEPPVQFDPVEKSTKTQVAEFRTSRFSVSAPTAVVVAALSVAGTWLAKPSTTVAMSPEDRAALQSCQGLRQEVADLRQESRTFRSWIEPQIGLLLVRTDSRGYTPPPPPPAGLAPSPPGFSEALQGKKP